MPLLLRTFLFVACCSISACWGLTFAPRDHGDVMWDTWIFKNPNGGWIMNYLVKHHTGRWNAVSTATSVDGSHWGDLGVAIRKDCANSTDCAVWLGSGSVWKYLKPKDAADQDDEYIMNFSQEYDCGGGNCQSIFFATSKDLINWTPVAPDAQAHGGTVFKYNSTGGLVSDYSRGRWDCIAVLPRPGGGYYGYWTATPTPQPGNPAHGCGGKGAMCGAGFGQSDDGLHWSTLPTPGPNIQAEVGGLAQIGGKTYMTFDAGHLFEAPSPRGPFTAVAQNHNFMTQEGGVAFARIWGELYTGSPDLVLLTHQTVAGEAVYLGVVKQVVQGHDGVVRAVWWPANDVLKNDPLALMAAPAPPGGASWPSGYYTTAAEMESGLWLEGSFAALKASIWFEMTGGKGFGVVFENSIFMLGPMGSNGNWTKTPVVVDRAMAGVQPAGGGGTWRILARNSWSGNSMIEFYVNNVLSLPFVPGPSFTGRFAAGANTTITAAHRLSLPGQ